MNNLKQRIQAGETVHGTWINMGSAVSAEMMGGAGFDWVLIDLEHGASSEADLLPQLQALGSSPSTPLVRVESFQAPRVKRALDAGVQGLMFPQIQDADEAREAIANMYYPPKGKRGLAKMIRATQYGTEFDSYRKQANEHLIGIIQIETLGALRQLDEIAQIEGVDVLFLGPADLSLALGIFGQWEHPDFVAAVKAISQAALKAGKAAGVLFLDPAQYEFYYQQGFRFLACGADMSFVQQGAQTMVRQLDLQRKKNLGIEK